MPNYIKPEFLESETRWIREGFDEAVIRTVTENACTLRFKDQGFEDE